MRTANQTLTQARFNKVPDKGYAPVLVQARLLEHCADTQSDYNSGTPMAKPGTVNAPETIEAVNLYNKYSNANLVDGKMFPGGFKVESEVIAMTANLLNHPDTNMAAGFMLSGGSESLNQALWMMKEKYFRKNHDIRIGETGLHDAIEHIREQQRNPGYNPVILMPIGMHFAADKNVDLQGLGKDSIRRYGLDREFNTDFDDLDKVIRESYSNGEEIIVNFCVAGDTQKGKVQDVARVTELLRQLSDEYGKPNPATVVDSAAQFLFLSTMRGSANYGLHMPDWDFTVPDVAAIVCDWHKNQIPYGAGALVLSNANDLKLTDQLAAYLHNNSSIDLGKLTEGERILASVASTIPTSRGGGSAFATWAHCLTQGKEGFMRSKERVWALTRLFADKIRNSRHYKLICEPQTSVVAFELNEHPEKHHFLYDNLNNSPDHNCFVSYSDEAQVRTIEQLRDHKRSSDLAKEAKYSGLHVHLMEHNAEDSVDETVQRLEDLAGKL